MRPEEAELLKQQTIELMKRVLKKDIFDFEVSICETEIHYFYNEIETTESAVLDDFISIEELYKLQWKRLYYFSLLALMTLCSAEELKVTTLEVKRVDYENGNMGATVFRIVCINEYKWLQYDGMHGSISQMFKNETINKSAQAIPCKN